MKKLVVLFIGFTAGLFVLSCQKEPISEPPEQEVPCRIIMRNSGGGYIKAQILIMSPFTGSIYVKNPTYGGSIKHYRPRIIDTSFVSPTITPQSRIVVNYGWGQIEK
jgi:hypothetical protein